MKINELIDSFEIWTTNEEKQLLKKLETPTKLKALEEQDQYRVQALIRKSLVKKTGFNDNPTLVSRSSENEKI
jgi:hypothetical protein